MKVSNLWLEFLDEETKSHCGLCANHGILNTTSLNLTTPAGLKLYGIKTYCICPNGRAMKKAKVKL